MGRIEKVLISGDRTWEAKHIIMQVLQETKPKIIVQGGQRGADLLARDCAIKLGIESRQYTAQWELYGRAAGPLRNREMIEKEKPEVVLAFHDNIEKSKGTRNMIMLANNRGIPVHLYRSSGEVNYNYTIL
jgi:YspA, cpYpsA-related SLOG family